MSASIDMPTRDHPELFYDQTFTNWLRNSLLLIPLTRTTHRPVLDAFVWPLLECYEQYRRDKDAWNEIIAAFDVPKLVKDVRTQIQATAFPSPDDRSPTDARLVKQVLSRLNVAEVHHQAYGMARRKPAPGGNERFGKALSPAPFEGLCGPGTLREFVQREIREKIRRGIDELYSDQPDAMSANSHASASSQRVSDVAGTRSVNLSTTPPMTEPFGSPCTHVASTEPERDGLDPQDLRSL